MTTNEIGIDHWLWISLMSWTQILKTDKSIFINYSTWFVSIQIMSRKSGRQSDFNFLILNMTKNVSTASTPGIVFYTSIIFQCPLFLSVNQTIGAVNFRNNKLWSSALPRFFCCCFFHYSWINFTGKTNVTATWWQL